MDFYQHQLTEYDVPLNHLDHEYIRKCNDASEIEKIIKILRSKHEGHFPDLEKLADERLSDLKPKSKLLWKESKLLNRRDLEEEERIIIDTEIKEWENKMKSADEELNSRSSDIKFYDDSHHPIRGVSTTISTKAKEKKTSSSKVNKKTKPRGYDEWDKLDIDAELKLVDDDDDKKKKINDNTTSKLGDNETMVKSEEFIFDKNLQEQLEVMKAEREKNKGNEAFKAGDYDEALHYYRRSITYKENAPAYNNRAQIYLNKKKWNQALDDCNSVINLEPLNVKAHMRRAVAYQGLTQYAGAQVDLNFVLEKEPTNKQAIALLKEIEKVLADQKVYGRRMMIEEVGGSDDDDDESDDDDDETTKLPNGDAVIERKENCKQEENNSSDDGVTRGDDDDSLGVSIPQPSERGGGDEINQLTNEKKDIKPGGVEITDPSKPKKTLEKIHDSSSLSPGVLPPSNPTSSLPRATHLKKADAMAKKAEHMFKVGQYGEAADLCGKALEHVGDQPQSIDDQKMYESVSLIRADSLFKSGDLSGCLRDCNNVLKFSPCSNEALIRKAMALEEKENYKEAYVCYRAIPDGTNSSSQARRASDRCASVLKSIFGSDWRNKLPCSSSSQPMASLNSAPALTTSPSLLTPLTPPLPSSPQLTKGELLEESGISSLPQTSSSSPSQAPTTTSVNSSSSSSSKASPATLSSSSSSPPLKECDMSDLYEHFKATGNSLFSKGEFNEAIQCFTKCIALKGQDVVPYTNRALCYLRLNQYEQVLDDCNQALIIDFHCSKALYRRALAFKMKAEFDKSLIDLETLLKIDPGNSAAKKEIITLQLMKEKKLFEKLKTRHRINITDVEDKCLREEKTSQMKHVKKSTMPTRATVAKTTTTRSVKPAVPLVTKVTSPYEFMQAFNSARFCEDLSEYVALFDALEPASLPKVLSNKLECDMLIVIVKCLKHYLETGVKERAKEYLESLVLVERFDMVVMFLSEADKSVMNELIEIASEEIDKEFVNFLKLKFRV